MAEEKVFLHGVALANYRGIGETPQLIGPFSQFNFFIGPNNSGKSCILNFIARHLNLFVCTQHNPISGRSIQKLMDFDVHIGATQHRVDMGIGIPKSIILNMLIESVSRYQNTHNLLNEILNQLSEKELIWFKRKSPEQPLSFFQGDPEYEKFCLLGHSRQWQELWGALRKMTGGSLQDHWVNESLEHITRIIDTKIPQINLIPAIREISPKGASFDDWTGKGLIEELARLQNPDVHERDKRKIFDKINSFLQAVTENTSATIEIPHDRNHVIVHMDKKILPLESLGTGIHEVIMLAAFCTLMEKQIVCIEEPEIHLHPVLQRRFIQYLQEKTNNQYFIATHSASLIDTQNATVFHVTNKGESTAVQLAISPTARFDICRDLGYKASDLLQANAIIWVEGPSDRIYIKHWIKAVDPELREGIDYSIMFYGGRLLSHLSAKEPETAEADVQAFIALRNINQNFAVVIDSDQQNPEDMINATKQRIRSELSGKGIAWITAGREIENYVPKDCMAQALKEVYNKFREQVKTGQYDHVLPFRRPDGEIFKEVDKVKVANAVCAQPPCLDVFDLKERINELVQFIRKANT